MNRHKLHYYSTHWTFHVIGGTFFHLFHGLKVQRIVIPRGVYAPHAQVCAMSGKGAGGFCSFDILCFVFLSTDTNQERNWKYQYWEFLLFMKQSQHRPELWGKTAESKTGWDTQNLYFRLARVSLSSFSSEVGPQKWLQLALLAGKTSGSRKQPWSLFSFKCMNIKSGDTLKNVECKCNTSFISSFCLRGPVNNTQFSSRTGYRHRYVPTFFFPISKG